MGNTFNTEVIGKVKTVLPVVEQVAESLKDGAAAYDELAVDSGANLLKKTSDNLATATDQAVQMNNDLIACLQAYLDHYKGVDEVLNG